MIAATLTGPNYSPNYDFDTIEVFDTLQDVIEALFERYSSNGKYQCDATYLDGNTTSTLYPTFGEGMSFTCYLMPDVDESDDTITATEALEGQRLEVHTAVHGGWKDYTVTLDESDEGTLRVIVEWAGI